MAKYNYYYRTNRQGYPIPATNFRTPRSLRQRGLVKFIPKIEECCVDGEPPTTFKNDGLGKYFVRLTSDLIPVSGTLKKFRKGVYPKSGMWQIVGNKCCKCVVDEIIFETNLSIIGEGLEEGEIGAYATIDSNLTIDSYNWIITNSGELVEDEDYTVEFSTETIEGITQYNVIITLLEETEETFSVTLQLTNCKGTVNSETIILNER